MSHSVISNRFRSSCLSLLFLTLLFITIPCHSQDLLKLIPSSSSGVFTMDGGRFFKKIDLAQINRLEMFQELDEMAQGRKGKKYQEFSKLYKAPEAIGLNINAKWHLFVDHSADTNMWGVRKTYVGMVMPLIKSSKFENFIKKVSDSTIHKLKSGYKYTGIGYTSIVAWNKNQMILLFDKGYSYEGNQDLVSRLNELITLSGEKNIKSNKNFMEAQAGKYDFHYWMHFGSLVSGMDLFKYSLVFPEFKNLPFAQKDFYKDYYLQLGLSFDNGSVHLYSRQFINDKAVKQVENLYGKGINPDLLKYIHKDHLLGIYSFSVNMKGIKETLDTIVHDTLKDKINEGFVNFLYSSKFKQDKKLSKLNKELDSMYTDLYSSRYKYDTTSYNYDYTDTASVNYNYNDYNYDADTVYSIEEEETYDSSEKNIEAPVESEDTEVIPPPDVVPTDSVALYYDDNYSYSDSVTVTEQNYYSSEDSIYEAKNERINQKNAEIKKRKDELSREKVKKLDIRKNDMLEMLDGDGFIAVTDYHFIPKKYKTYEYDEEEYKTVEVEKVKSEPFPDLLLALSLNNAPRLESLLGKLAKDDLLTKKDHYYIVDDTQKVYLAVAGKILLVTNDEALINKNIKGYDMKDRISREIQDLVTDKTVSFYINLKDIFARLPYDSMSKQKSDTYTMLMNSIVNTYATSGLFQGNINDSEFALNFTNKLDNSFYEILRLINETYKINKANR